MKYLLIIFFALISLQNLEAQTLKSKPRRSPVGLENYKKGDTYIKVTYGRPHMRDDFDKPFGRKVPWRKVWRLGDDDATEITTTKDITLGGETLPAGTYSLLAIPDTAEWTLIVNKEVGMWGTYKYNPKKDLFRLKLPVLSSPKIFKDFTVFFQEDGDDVNLVFVWDRITVMSSIGFKEE